MTEGKQGGTSALKIMLGVAGGIVLVSCCVIGGCIALIGMRAKGVAEEQQQEQKQAAEAKKTPITVSPVTLLSEYRANEVAADGKYKGKWLRLRGPVEKIATGFTDTIHVTFESGGFGIVVGVRGVFDDKSTDKAEAAQLSPGQTISVIGKCNGKYYDGVLVEECEFAD